ncbi:hypothetical protein PSCICO_50530 [Pseudomonas cichorii]|nr:hypothetical protein PSCICN_22400 [Pseudomonas cichorii]GFM89654.1 hypothetical protein PSCICO_50530 [Pseudomonas cichorii]
MDGKPLVEETSVKVFGVLFCMVTSMTAAIDASGLSDRARAAAVKGSLKDLNFM